MLAADTQSRNIVICLTILSEEFTQGYFLSLSFDLLVIVLHSVINFSLLPLGSFYLFEVSAINLGSYNIIIMASPVFKNTL